MAFNKTINLPDGSSASYHRLNGLALRRDPGSDKTKIDFAVETYRSAATRAEGKMPVMIQGMVENWHTGRALTPEQVAVVQPYIDALWGAIYDVLLEDTEIPQFAGASKVDLPNTP